MFRAAHPLCVHCYMEGIIKQADEVDHIIPHRGDADLFWDERNWQSLCREHHARKTARELQLVAQGGGNV